MENMDYDKNILIAAPVRSRAWIISEYLNALYNLDYDKSKISFFWIVNDSSDQTINALLNFKMSHSSEYANIEVINIDLGAPIDARSAVRKKYIYKNLAFLRNMILSKFLELKEIEYLFSIDSDIIISPNSLKQLIKDDKEIVSCYVSNAYMNMSIGNATELTKLKHGWDTKHIDGTQMPEIFECGLTGAAYLIKRKVIEAGVRYGFVNSGEDTMFCASAGEKGFRIFSRKNLAVHKMKLMIPKGKT